MEKKEFYILIPPSKEKTFGGDENKPYRFVQNLKKFNFFINLNHQREFIYAKIKEGIANLSEKDLEKIFDAKGKKLYEALEINSDLLNGATKKAIDRYNGVMFKSLDFKSLSEVEKNNFNKKTIIIDGLFGMLKPYDYIPNYRFDIDKKFLDLNVSNYWKDYLRGEGIVLFKDKIVIDLLPQNYRKLITKPSSCEYYEVNFSEIKNGKVSNVGHNSKKLKGELLRYLAKFEQISIKDLENFKHSQGFEFSKDLSKEGNIIYLKK